MEGYLYGTLEEKAAAGEAFLTELAADADRVRHLLGRDWVVEALDGLPASAPDHVA